MMLFTGISLIIFGFLGSFLVSYTLLLKFINSSFFSKRFKQNKKNLEHWNGKGYYQRILK
jgi:hypothetical protein